MAYDDQKWREEKGGGKDGGKNKNNDSNNDNKGKNGKMEFQIGDSEIIKYGMGCNEEAPQAFGIINYDMDGPEFNPAIASFGLDKLIAKQEQDYQSTYSFFNRPKSGNNGCSLDELAKLQMGAADILTAELRSRQFPDIKKDNDEKNENGNNNNDNNNQGRNSQSGIIQLKGKNVSINNPFEDCLSGKNIKVMRLGKKRTLKEIYGGNLDDPKPIARNGGKIVNFNIINDLLFGKTKKENLEEIINVQVLQCPSALYRENHHKSGDNNVKDAIKHVAKTRGGDISPANDVVVLATIELNNGKFDINTLSRSDVIPGDSVYVDVGAVDRFKIPYCMLHT